MLAADDAQGFWFWYSGVVLAHTQQFHDGVSAAVEELGELDACRTASLDDEFLLGTTRTPVEFSDEIAHCACTLAIILVAGDVGCDVAFELFDGVPMRARRVQRAPLAPGGIGRRTVDEGFAVPLTNERQVWVERRVIAGDL